MFIFTKYFKLKFNYLTLALLYSISSFSQVVATIENVTGDIFFFNNDEKILLEIYDEINLNQKIFTGKNSEITISLDDGTTILLFNEAQFFFNGYANLYSVKPFFELTIESGGFTIETGEIPKISPDNCKIITPKGTLVVNGTAINANFSGNQAEIFLLTDSLGNKGNLNLVTNNGDNVAFEIDKGISLNGSEIKASEPSEDVRNKFENLKVAIIESTIIDEVKMENIFKKKLESGKIKDLDGDGKVDAKDLELLKKNIVSNKTNKLDAIINNTDSDSEILSKIVESSPDNVSTKIFEKIIEAKPELTNSVVEKIINNNANKMNNLMLNNEKFTESIIQTVVSESNDANSISKILSNTNDEISTKILTQVIENKSDLLTEVIANTASNNSDKLNSILDENIELNLQLTSTIASNITGSTLGDEELKNVITNLDTKLSNQVLQTVNSEDSDLVAKTINQLIDSDEGILEEKLAKAINEDSSVFSEIIIESAITRGEISIISNASNKLLENNISASNQEISVNNNQNNSNNDAEKNKNNLLKISQQIEKKTEEIKKLDPNFNVDKDILDNINEKLVSPN